MKQTQRSSEATLVPSFVSLHLKKFDLEFSVDPLFKKASADFDEGGARGLLLNNLAIDNDGRLSFDSSEDSDTTEKTDSPDLATDKDVTQTIRIDTSPSDANLSNEIASLGAKYFSDLQRIDAQVLCPSMREFDVGNPSQLPLSLAIESEAKDPAPDVLQSMDSNDIDQGYGDFGLGDGLDEPLAQEDGLVNVGFGEGGEDWVLRTVPTSQENIADDNMGIVWKNDNQFPESQDMVAADQGYGVSLHYAPDQSHLNGMLGFLDNILEKNWAGPEHWRIQKVRDVSATKAPAHTKRKEKDMFEINFASELSEADTEAIRVSATSNSSISQPRSHLKSSARNFLPDDKHFNSRDLLTLFLKPKAFIGQIRRQSKSRESEPKSHSIRAEGVPWAIEDTSPTALRNDESPHGDYDADFFQDDGFGVAPDLPGDEDEFENAREAFSPPHDSSNATGNAMYQQGPFGSQLIAQGRKAKPEYVQYAKSAKRVDVRQLKEQVWTGIEKEAEPKFTTVLKSLHGSYSQEAIQDISTSYCFICLLHLANENGLSLANSSGLEELSIQKVVC